MLKENVSAVSARKSDESPGQTGRKLGANDPKARGKRIESSEQTTRKHGANFKLLQLCLRLTELKWR